MKDLHSKTLIQILKADPSRVDFLQQIDVYLGNVETYIIYATKDRLGPKYVKNLTQKMRKARKRFTKREVWSLLQYLHSSFQGFPEGNLG